MSKKNGRIIIVGQGSRIASRLAERLGHSARLIGRTASFGTGGILVEDYAAIPPDAFSSADWVVNCVGISEGSEQELTQVNVELPLRMARTARDAGVRRFLHISSFSVYGASTQIDQRSLPAPLSAYGRSKLAGDEALAALAADGFDVTLLRLPLIYSPGQLGKLGQLLTLWRRIRVFPVPIKDVQRAMIGADLAAEVIVRLIATPISQVVHAADPEPFTYNRTASASRDELRTIILPAALVAMAFRIAPQLAQRLYADSVLASDDNVAVRFGMSSRLYTDIAAARL